MTASSPRTIRRSIGLLLGLAVSGAAGYFAARGVAWSLVADAFTRLRAWPLAIALAISVLALFSLAWRSQVLFRSIGTLPLEDHVFSHLLAFVGNTVLPLRAGELMRLDYVARHGNAAHGSCLAMLVVERMFDLMFMLGCFFVSIPLSTGKVPLVWGVVGVAIATICGLATLLAVARAPEPAQRAMHAVLGLFGATAQRVVGSRIASFSAGLSSLSAGSALLRIAGFTVLRWTVGLVNIRLWLLAFGITAPWYASIVLQAFLAFGTAVPSTVAFAGTYHFALITGLAVFGVPKELAVSVAVVGHAISFLPFSTVGAVWIARRAAVGSYRMPAL